MELDSFAERLAVIRQRFASTVEGKIAEAWEALPQAVGDDATAVTQRLLAASAATRLPAPC